MRLFAASSRKRSRSTGRPDRTPRSGWTRKCREFACSSRKLKRAGKPAGRMHRSWKTTTSARKKSGTLPCTRNGSARTPIEEVRSRRRGRRSDRARISTSQSSIRADTPRRWTELCRPGELALRLGRISIKRCGYQLAQVHVGNGGHFQSFQREIACDLKVLKLAGLHFTSELSPSRANIALAQMSLLSSTSVIHLRQLNTVAL